jgi:sensor histidine kinase YesM
MLPYLVGSADNGYKIGSIPGSFFTIVNFIHMGIFYGNAYFLYPRFFNRRYWWLYLVLSLLLIAGSFVLKFIILSKGYPELGEDPTKYKFVFAPSFAAYIISVVYRRILNNIEEDRKAKEREATQLITELKFLRSQISPHFLFNVLTNLVSLARKKSDKLEESLIRLSDLMRYMLYDAQAKKVKLQKEIEYLESYIALQKLRFSNDVIIDWDVNIEPETNLVLIEPMLLIPFVENAFKHGMGFTEHTQITIRLSVVNSLLLFEVKNKFDKTQNSSEGENSGIGLQNVKSRLDLLYKDNYSLVVDDTGNYFHITLHLKL